jgi:hypothetical protein
VTTTPNKAINETPKRLTLRYISVRVIRRIAAGGERYLAGKVGERGGIQCTHAARRALSLIGIREAGNATAESAADPLSHESGC